MALLHFLDDLGTLFQGLHVQGNQTVVTLRQGLVESLLYTLVADHRSHLKKSTQDNHVEDLAVLHLCAGQHGA